MKRYQQNFCFIVLVHTFESDVARAINGNATLVIRIDNGISINFEIVENQNIDFASHCP